MPAECPVCGLAYEPELGFYFRAMYVNYVFSTAIVLVVGLVIRLRQP
jgi:hypothetical protein